MAYLLEHTKLGFCWWDLIALIVLIVVIVAFAWKDQISELYADDTVQIDNQV